MKKAILTAFSVILIVFTCVGCTPPTVTIPALDSPLPWFAYRNFETETATYEVSKVYMISENNVALVNDTQNSHLIYKLTQWTDENNTSLCKLETDFKITYTASEYIDESYATKVDEIKSTAIFRTDNLAAVSTTKTVTLQTNPQKSYSYSVDYATGVATFVVNNHQSQLSFSKGNYIDNEYLYYYVRSMKNLGSTLNESFSLVNWYECYLKDEFITYPMAARYYAAESVKIGDSTLLDGFSAEHKDTEAGTVSCNNVQIILNETKQGSPLYTWYTQSPYQIETNKSAKKLLAMIRTYENTLDGIVTYRTDYTLQSFSTTFKTAQENA